MDADWKELRSRNELPRCKCGRNLKGAKPVPCLGSEETDVYFCDCGRVLLVRGLSVEIVPSNQRYDYARVIDGI